MNAQSLSIVDAAQQGGRNPGHALAASLLDMRYVMSWHRQRASADWQRTAHDKVIAWLDQFMQAAAARPGSDYRAPVLTEPPEGTALIPNEAVILGFDRATVSRVTAASTARTATQPSSTEP
ncbi:MAG: hypothetical protein KF678_15525 [Phycisphaeraceae bacterium]|nr:hypothetical protein [Phycisphaeraceae bacterium]